MPISFTRATWTDYVGPPFLAAAEVNRWETALDALINGSSRAVQISGDTMTGNLTVNGWIESDGGYRDAAGVTRVSSTGAGALTTLTTTGVHKAQAESFAQLELGKVGYGGVLAFARSTDGALGAFIGFQDAFNEEFRTTVTASNNVYHTWHLRNAANPTGREVMRLHNSGGLSIGNTTDPGVGGLRVTGLATLAQATVSDLTANLPIFADATKKLATESASAFRSRIGAASDSSEKVAAGRLWRTKVTTSTLYGEVRYNPVAYGNGVWVQAMGDITPGSTVARRSTDDGATWTEIVLPTAGRWYGLTWCTGSSLFVLVGNNAGGAGVGVVLTSPDGATWTSRTNTLSYPYAVAASGNTVVVACNGGGVQGRSIDGGVTWTTFASPAGSSYYRINFCGGRFVMTSQGLQNSASSADGVTWSTSPNPVSFGWAMSAQPIAYLNGRWWLTMGGDIFTSTNGHTWVNANTLTGWFIDTASAVPSQWCSIAFSANAMIAHAETVAGDGGVWVTVDGVWWDLARNYGNSVGNVAQQGSQFYAFGYRSLTNGFTAYAPA